MNAFYIKTVSQWVQNLASITRQLCYRFRLAKAASVGTFYLFANVHSLFLLFALVLVGGSSCAFAQLKTNALAFDGINDKIVLTTLNNAPLGGSARTIEAWIKTTAPNNTLFTYGTNYYYQAVNLGMNTGISFDSSDSAVSWTAGTPLYDGQWHHVAWVYPGGVGLQNSLVYADGVLMTVSGTPYNGAIPLSTTTGIQPHFGDSVNGEIDELRIWNVARTQAQILATKDVELTGTETGLVAYYKFNQCSGTTLPDLSGNGNNGTLTNMTGTEWTGCPAPVSATNVTTTGFTANWNAVNGATKYRLDVGSDPSFSTLLATNIDAGTGTSFNVTGLNLTPGTPYYYRMRLERGSWTSPNSASSVMLSPGNALSFNGSNTYVQMNDVNLGTSDFTIEGWIKPVSPASYGYLYTSRTSESTWSGNWFSVIVSGGKLGIEVAAGLNQVITGNSTLTANVWSHIAVVRSPTTFTLYVNGVQDGQLSDNASSRNLATGTNITRLGGWVEYNALWYNGQIDDFRVWNVARTQTEIQSNLYKTLAGNETGLVAYYNFDQSSGTTLPDLTGHGHDGTLYNSPSWTASGALCPFPISASNITTTSFTANWNAVSGATGYRLDVSTDPNFGSFLPNGSNLALPVGTSSNVTGLTLTPNTPYYYRMRVERGTWTSPNSATVSFMFPPGNALQFNGSTQYVDAGTGINLANQSFTVELWARRDVNGSNQMMISQGPGLTNQAFAVALMNNDKFLFSFYANDLYTSATYTDNNWHHWACVYDASVGIGTDRWIYRDGVLVASDNASGNFQGSGNLYIGMNSYGGGYFPGQIDEVRIWNVARTQTQIQSNMHKPLVGNETGLVAYYNFDQSSGTTLPDLTGHSHNGTLVNTPTWSTATWVYLLTGTASAITDVTASVSGNVTNDNTTSITASGICYGTTTSPTTPCTTDGTGSVTFNSSLTGLTPNTLYYARAYATNPAGTFYDSNEVTFTTLVGQQTIAFTPPTSATYGDAPLTLSATGGASGNPVTFATTTPTICTVSGTTLTIISGGTCTVTANQAGNTNYYAAPPVNGNITIGPANQFINFTPLAAATVGDRPVTLSATATSGLPVIFASSTPSVCAVSGSTFTVIRAGTCIVTADQTGNANYQAAPQASQQLMINSISPPTLHIVLAGTGTGRITSDVGGIDCSPTSSSCTYTVNTPTWVTLTDLPDHGSQLTRWTGDPACTATGQVLILQDTSCTAEFTLQSYQLTANFLGTGRVTGPGIDCPGQCTATYLYGTTVTLKAQATRKMWEFSGWRGCDNQGNIQITKDVLCQAVFTPDSNIPNAGDGNGDGLPDANQDNVVSLPDKVTGTYLTLETQPATCVISDIYPDLAEAQTLKLEHTKKFVQGLLYFDLACPQVQVSVYYHAMTKLSRNLKFYKFGPKIPGDLTTLAWYQLPIKYELVTIGGQPVVKGTYTLTDGELGDSTGVDGHIVDPGGLVYP